MEITGICIPGTEVPGYCLGPFRAGLPRKIQDSWINEIGSKHRRFVNS